MSEKRLIILLKLSIGIGLFMIGLGIYLHNFSEEMEALGVTGIIISAVCIAIGFIFSLPTKMFLTIILVQREEKQAKQSTDKTHKKNDVSIKHE
tara:strand:- start:30818 stop:31099 length:282 start_codon:yes stop_codon:yes gene_type:complete